MNVLLLAEPTVWYFLPSILAHNVLDIELKLPQGLKFKIPLSQAQI